MWPYLQLCLLLLTTLLFHIGVTNPNSTSSTDHVPYESAPLKFAVFFGPQLGKLLIWTCTLYQVLYLYLQATLSPLIATLYPQVATTIDPLPLSLVTVLGYVLMTLGGLGRLWCYRTLGKFFTFELTIRSSHKLIKRGPYAYVRHPSYTFACLLTIGMFLVHRRLANFFPHSAWVHFQFGPAGFLACCLLFFLIIRTRVLREEVALSEKFREEWADYASRTTRFVPGMF